MSLDKLSSKPQQQLLNQPKSSTLPPHGTNPPQQSTVRPTTRQLRAEQNKVWKEAEEGKKKDQQQEAKKSAGNATIPAHFDLGVGSTVQLATTDPITPQRYGVIGWIGCVAQVQGPIAGIELVRQRVFF